MFLISLGILFQIIGPYRLCKEIEYEIVYRGLLEPPAEFETVKINAYINAVNFFSRFRLFSKESVIAFTLDHMGLSLPSLKLSWGDKVRSKIFRSAKVGTRI